MGEATIEMLSEHSCGILIHSLTLGSKDSLLGDTGSGSSATTTRCTGSAQRSRIRGGNVVGGGIRVGRNHNAKTRVVVLQRRVGHRCEFTRHLNSRTGHRGHSS